MYKVYKEDLDTLIYGIHDAVEFYEDNPTIVQQGNYVLLELSLIQKRMAAIEYFNNEEPGIFISDYVAGEIQKLKEMCDD